MLLILRNAKNMLRITHYKMYLKYLFGSHNAKKIFFIKKIYC